MPSLQHRPRLGGAKQHLGASRTASHPNPRVQPRRTDEIDNVSKDLEKEGVGGAIRSCWNKTVALFEHDQPKVAKSTETPPAK